MIALISELWREPSTRAVVLLFGASVVISTLNLFYGGRKA